MFEIWQFVVREWREVKQAKAAVAACSVLAFGLGWLAASKYYGDVIAFLRLQIEHPLPVSSAVVVTRGVWWWSVVLWSVVSAMAVACAVLAVSLRRRNKAASALIRRVDALQESNAATSKQADAAKAALKETKRAHAIEILQRYSRVTFPDRMTGEQLQPNVTIRYCSYGGGDYELAKKIEALFLEHTKWVVHLDASNNPALPRAARHKVFFDFCFTLSYHDMIRAFSEGDLLGVALGHTDITHARRNDCHNLIVQVLPSADASSKGTPS